MKKASVLMILCVTLLTGCSLNITSPVEKEEKTATREAAFKMYAKRVQELEEEYGVLSIDIYPYGLPDDTWYTVNGLSYLNLTDFDDDGIEELVAVTGRYGIRQCVRVFTAKESGPKEIYCNYVGGGGSPVIFQVEISKQHGKNYLMRQTASPTYDVFEMRDGIMKSLGQIDGGSLTFYNDPEEIADQIEESRSESNSYIFNFPKEFCPGAPDALLTAVNEVKGALSLKTQESYEILNSPEEEYSYYAFMYRGCTIEREGIDEVTKYSTFIYDPVFVREDTKKEYAFDDLDDDGMEEMLLREDEKDLYIIKKNNRGEELVDDEELIFSAKSRTETYTAIPDKELFTSPYSLEVEDYFDDNLTIKEAIAINGDDYEIGCYDGDVIVKYKDIGFLPSASDPAELSFDMNSTIDKVIIFGDRRVYGALYGQTTLPQIKATLKSSYLPVDKELEKTHNETEDCDEYLFETDSWRYHYCFKWIEDPEISPCVTVEVMIKDGE